MADDLFTIKNEFYLGNYQQAINEAQASDLVISSAADQRDRDVIVYRSYIALGNYDVVQTEIKDDAPTALQDNRDIAMITLKEWLGDPQTGNNPTLQLIAGTIFLDQGELEEAAKVLHAGTTLEMVALQVQVYLRMARVDVAEKSLGLMTRMEDDATLTQLCTAWVNLSLGGEKVQEAFFILQELTEKFSESSVLLNGMAVAQMQLGKFEEAEKLLLRALNKNSSDVATLQNLVVVGQHTRKAPEVLQRYINTLARSAPKCSLIQRKEQARAMEALFDRCASAADLKA